jgi:hypothetical protein
MICPFRQITKTQTLPDGTVVTAIDFDKCLYQECPHYLPESSEPFGKDGKLILVSKEKCTKVCFK